jgi:hypothetical protein
MIKEKELKKNKKSSKEQKTGPSFIGHMKQEKIFEKEIPLGKLDLKVKREKKKKSFDSRNCSNISLYLVNDTQFDKSIT